MKDRIETIIRDWLNTTFGNPDAIPNLMVKGLAEEIDKHRFEIHNYVKDEYDLEDVQAAADNNNVTLTKDEESLALHRYNKAQEYDSALDYLDEIISEIIDAREEK